MSVISAPAFMSFGAELRYRIESVADRALSFVMPPTCGGCYRNGTALCDECRPAFEGRTGGPLGMSNPSGMTLPPSLVQLEWCAPRAGVAGRAVDRLTAVGDIRLARPLGEAIARRWAAAGTGGDVLVPVPATVERTRDRGYDQAALLAQAAGRKLHLPVMAVLRRRGPDVEVLDTPRIRGRWIVLIDDVVTTGATLAACADALLAAGARAVSAVVVAEDRPSPIAAPRFLVTA
jgi:predicted amidophosphoribosyltransferase